MNGGAQRHEAEAGNITNGRAEPCNPQHGERTGGTECAESLASCRKRGARKCSRVPLLDPVKVGGERNKGRSRVVRGIAGPSLHLRDLLSLSVQSAMVAWFLLHCCFAWPSLWLRCLCRVPSLLEGAREKRVQWTLNTDPKIIPQRLQNRPPRGPKWPPGGLRGALGRQVGHSRQGLKPLLAALGAVLGRLLGRCLPSC